MYAVGFSFGGRYTSSSVRYIRIRERTYMTCCRFVVAVLPSIEIRIVQVVKFNQNSRRKKVGHDAFLADAAPGGIASFTALVLIGR